MEQIIIAVGVIIIFVLLSDRNMEIKSSTTRQKSLFMEENP